MMRAVHHITPDCPDAARTVADTHTPGLRLVTNLGKSDNPDSHTELTAVGSGTVAANLTAAA